MPKATTTPTTPKPIARRRGVRPAGGALDRREAITNVVALPKRVDQTEAIVAAVTGATRQQSEALTQRMQAMVAEMNIRHREHAQQLVGLGVRMDRPTLDDFIEIGRRLLAAKGGR